MALSMKSFSNGKIQLKAARVLVGMPGHRPSAFNIKVGKCMKQKKASPAGGGRYSKTFQTAFVECVRESGGKLGEKGMKFLRGGGGGGRSDTYMSM
jgi:hypothetical protein